MKSVTVFIKSVHYIMSYCLVTLYIQKFSCKLFSDISNREKVYCVYLLCSQIVLKIVPQFAVFFMVIKIIFKHESFKKALSTVCSPIRKDLPV